MSAKNRKEVLAGLRKKYLRAGAEYRVRLIDQAVELLGYHRKAAIRALNTAPQPPESAPAVRTGRPREYHRGTLLVVLRPIWFAAQQPCGSRLAAMLPEWLPAYEADHRRLDADVREALLKASARTLDRLLGPLRAGLARRGGTRPGSLLRQQGSGAKKADDPRLFVGLPLRGRGPLVCFPGVGSCLTNSRLFTGDRSAVRAFRGHSIAVSKVKLGWSASLTREDRPAVF